MMYIWILAYDMVSFQTCFHMLLHIHMISLSWKMDAGTILCASSRNPSFHYLGSVSSEFQNQARMDGGVVNS